MKVFEMQARLASGLSWHVGHPASARTRRRPVTLILSCGLLGSSLILAGPARSADQTAAACPASATGAVGTQLHIALTGLRNDDGAVSVTLYGEKAKSFMAHRGWIAQVRVKPAGRQTEACFAVSGPGTYAVAVYHDANDNHHFDRTFLGLPAEGYGFSNDAPTPIGPPPFSAAKFIVQPGGTAISIHLRY
ncbi:MAG: DUF2141 domain-containing protein [Janthinobacterium lividum]